MSPKKEEISSYTSKAKQRFVYLEKFERTKQAIRIKLEEQDSDIELLGHKFNKQEYYIELLEKKISILTAVLSIASAVLISVIALWIIISI